MLGMATSACGRFFAAASIPSFAIGLFSLHDRSRLPVVVPGFGERKLVGGLLFDRDGALLALCESSDDPKQAELFSIDVAGLLASTDPAVALDPVTLTVLRSRGTAAEAQAPFLRRRSPPFALDVQTAQGLFRSLAQTADGRVFALDNAGCLWRFADDPAVAPTSVPLYIENELPRFRQKRSYYGPRLAASDNLLVVVLGNSIALVRDGALVFTLSAPDGTTFENSGDCAVAVSRTRVAVPFGNDLLLLRLVTGGDDTIEWPDADDALVRWRDEDGLDAWPEWGCFWQASDARLAVHGLVRLGDEAYGRNINGLAFVGDTVAVRTGGLLNWVSWTAPHTLTKLWCAETDGNELYDNSMLIAAAADSDLIVVGSATATASPAIVAAATAIAQPTAAEARVVQLIAANAFYHAAAWLVRGPVITALREIRWSASEIAIALEDLHLPALLTLEIIDAALPNAVRMAAKWDLVTAVKHFRERR